MSKDREKDEKHSNLVLIHNAIREVVLTDEETALKNLLLALEAKVESIEKVQASLIQEYPDSIAASEIFSSLVGAVVAASAADILGDFFGLPQEQVVQILE